MSPSVCAMRTAVRLAPTQLRGEEEVKIEILGMEADRRWIRREIGWKAAVEVEG